MMAALRSERDTRGAAAVRHALLNGGGGAGGAGSGVTAALAALVARDDAAFEAPRRGVLRTCP